MEPKPTDEPHHDREIGRRDWLSLISVLFVQTQNAFNDNFVKMVLIGLGLAVAQGVIVLGADVGENIQFILTALIPIAFILGAPISGWISDRFSKKWVLIYCVLLQLGIFVLIYLAVIWRQVGLAIFGYFLLSVQSTLFSPAKQGILKELVGGKRLALANGLMQMLTMVGILAGIGLGGKWFDTLLADFNAADGIAIGNTWRAAELPTITIGLCCLAPILIS
ncbi:MAG: MFS transporter, partial [Verrucomicrobiota bacterium]